MEIKAQLNKPYTENQRIDFIITQNRQNGYEIRETELALEAWGYTEDEKAEQRKQEFLKDFFKVEGFGYYRVQPKGYQSAIESLNTAFNNFILMQQSGITEFPADVFIFYTEPDFTDSEQCTEEWLVAHQYKNNAWTAQEFGVFYSTFTRAWNNQEHETTKDEEPVEENIETPVEEEPTEENIETPVEEEPTEENIETPVEESNEVENG